MKMKQEENEETKGINATLILQVMGRPPEHLTKTLKDLIGQIDNEDKVQVKSKEIKEPVKSQEKTGSLDKEGNETQQEFYSSFAEVEVDVEEIMNLIVLMFKYMPSHIEINYPEYIALTNGGWGEILNELVRRLHGYDEVARVAQVEKTILERKLREALGDKKDQGENQTKKTENKNE